MPDETRPETEGTDSRTFDEAQQPTFGNQRVIPDSTRPPVGTQSDPLLPGEPVPGAEQVYERPPELPSNEHERGDKLP